MDLGVGFEARATEAFLDAIMDDLRGAAEQVIREAARDALVGAQYDADGILDTLTVRVQRRGQRVVVAWTFDHEAAEHLEFGTSDHTIEGDPLAFEWDDAPAEVQEMFQDTFPTVFFQSVEVSGIQETAFTRRSQDALVAYLSR